MARLEPARVPTHPVAPRLLRLPFRHTSIVSGFVCPLGGGMAVPLPQPLLLGATLASSEHTSRRARGHGIVSLLSGLQVEGGNPRFLGLNICQAAAWCCSCIARYSPGFDRSMRFSSTNLTNVDRSEVIFSRSNPTPVAMSPALNARPRFTARYWMTRSVQRRVVVRIAEV